MQRTARGYTGPRPSTYPRKRALGAQQLFDQLTREAARQVRAGCTQQPDHATAQQFTDATKGRPIGTFAIARMLAGARNAGAPREVALQFARALETFTLGLYTSDRACVRTVAIAETVAQGRADAAVLDALTSESPAKVKAALELLGRHQSELEELRAVLQRHEAELEARVVA